MEKPKVSVIMGIYNCESTLNESLNSLLDQTFQEFEVIMCDDGSIDATYLIAKKFCENYPEKFFLIKNERNMGLNYTLNKCLDIAKGKYIARMDGDDISLPQRFEMQVDYLDNHPGIAIVSSPMVYFDESGDWGVGHPKPKPEKKDLILGTPFAHAPCMVRIEAYKAVNGYSEDKKLLRVEDYHLWVKMFAMGFIGVNIPEPLYKMRDDQNAFKRRKFRYRFNEAYVKHLAIKNLNLHYWNYIYLLRPILLGLLPTKLYMFLHKNRMKQII